MNQRSETERTCLQRRITDRVDVVDLGFATSCWISNRAAQPNGYTKFGYRGKTWLTHRLSYEVYREEIPNELVIDHLCRNRACVNPDHLEPVTNRDNLLRGEGFVAKQARRAYCTRGHELTGDNLYVPPKRPRSRQCRTCRSAASSRAWAERQPLVVA